MRGAMILMRSRDTGLIFSRSYFKIIYSIFIMTLTVLMFSLLSECFQSGYKIFGQIQNQTILSLSPTVSDPNLKVELVASNFDFPTSMEFVGKDDIVLLEKNTGNGIE